jgi:hypothetical protein
MSEAPIFLDEELTQVGEDTWTNNLALIMPDNKKGSFIASPTGDLIGFIPSAVGDTPTKAAKALEKLAVDRFRKVGKALGYNITS